jgi:lipid-A-disaccharide synthase
MAETLDLLLTIFPFEAKCFAHTALNVQFVGNPIKEYIIHYHYEDDWRQKIGIPQCPFISLFPGSRSIEIKRHLGIQLEAAVRLKAEQPETALVVSCGHRETEPLVRQMIQRSSLKLNRDLFLVPKKYAYEMMRDSEVAIAKSGTVTLELALHRRPTVVIYQASLANRLFVKHIVRPQVTHFCIVNILAGQEVFPELIARGLSAENVYREIKKLNNPSKRQACLEDCQRIYHLLGSDEASRKAAYAIEKYL